MSPVVSIALITYNHERWIRDAIAGIHRQQIDFPCEIVVADDASSDATFQILQQELDNERFRVNFLPHDQRLGMHQNWLRALDACQGEFVAVLEGDDYWTAPEKLSQQVSALRSHPEWTGCSHRIEVIDREGTPLYLMPPPDQVFEETNFRDLIARNRITTVSVMYRNGLRPEYPAEFLSLKQIDWPMHLLHAQQGTIGFLPEVMAVYRHHGEGVWTAQTLSQQLEHIYRAWDAFEDYFGSDYSSLIRERRLEELENVCRLLSEAENSKDFRLGRTLLKPYRLLRNWLSTGK